MTGPGFLWPRRMGALMEQVKAAGKALKVFISYGHDDKCAAHPAGRLTQERICVKLCEALKDRGHSPWIDRDGIKERDDWRVEILKGLSDTDVVLACVSKRSLRSGSVCHEELKLSGGAGGENIAKILPVLLEPEGELSEGEVSIPRWLADREWFDLSGWKSWEKEDDPAFQDWFVKRTDLLFSVLESKGYEEYSREINRLRTILRPAVDTMRQSALSEHPFLGRKWLEEKIQCWLADENGKKVCFLSGEPGTGKSAYAYHFSAFNPTVAAAMYFCAGHKRENDPVNIIRTLAYLLAVRIPQYRYGLLNDISTVKVSLEEQSPQELFETLIRRPLIETIDGGHETMVIVLDGLDECANRGDKNEAVKVLLGKAGLLPGWLRILAVSQNVPEVTSCLPDHETVCFPSDTGDNENNRDIAAYCEKRVGSKFGSDPNWEAVRETLVRRSRGSFLYAEMICDMMKQEDQLRIPENYPGLNSIFEQWFDRSFGNSAEYQSHYRAAMSCITGAPEPLPKVELKVLFEWTDTEVDCFIRKTRSQMRLDISGYAFTKEERQKKDAVTLQIAHTFVAEWLKDNEKNPSYYTSPLDGCRLMADHYDTIRKEKGVSALSTYEVVLLPELRKTNLGTQEWRQLGEDTEFLKRYRKEGDTCALWGKSYEARQIYEGGIALLKTASRVPERGKLLADFYSSLGDLCENEGSLTEAAGWYEKAERILADPLNGNLAGGAGYMPTAGKRYAIACGNLANVLMLQGDVFRALKYWESAKENYEKAQKEERSAADWQNLAKIYLGMAETRKISGNFTEAQKYDTKALKCLKQLYKLETTAEVSLCLSEACSSLGRMKNSGGEVSEAERYLYQALHWAREAHERRSSIAEKQNLISVHFRRGMFALEQEKPEEAIKEFEESLHFSEEVVLLRGNPFDRWTQVRILAQNARACQLCGDIPKAGSLYENAVSKAKEIVRRFGTLAGKEQMLEIYKSYLNFLVQCASEKKHEGLAETPWQQGDSVCRWESKEKPAEATETCRQQEDSVFPYDSEKELAEIADTRWQQEEFDSSCRRDGTLVQVTNEALELAKDLAAARGTVKDNWTLQLLEDLNLHLKHTGNDRNSFQEKEKAVWNNFKKRYLSAGSGWEAAN